MTHEQWVRRLLGYDIEPMLELNPYSDMGFWYQELCSYKDYRTEIVLRMLSRIVS